MTNATQDTVTNSNATTMTATRIEYKGRVIVDSNRLEGWFMTECGTIAADNIEEVKFDIDYTGFGVVVAAEDNSLEAYWAGSPSAMVSASLKVYVQL